MLLNINEEDYYDFDLLGISSHEKNYRLVWSLNRGMNWMLSKVDDVCLDWKGVSSSHSVFKYDDMPSLKIALLKPFISANYPSLITCCW